MHSPPAKYAILRQPISTDAGPSWLDSGTKDTLFAQR